MEKQSTWYQQQNAAQQRNSTGKGQLETIDPVHTARFFFLKKQNEATGEQRVAGKIPGSPGMLAMENRARTPSPSHKRIEVDPK